MSVHVFATGIEPGEIRRRRPGRPVPRLLMGRHAADAVKLFAMSHQGHALKRRPARELFPGLAVFEIEPAEVLRRRAIMIFMRGAGVTAVYVEPVAEHRPAEAIDRLGKKGKRAPCSSRPKRLGTWARR